jgi:DNA-binding NtrC family response regulator
MKPLKVLVLDDDLRIREEIAEFLTEMDYDVVQADRPSKAGELLDSFNPDLMIIDINLPEKDGLTYLHEIKEFHPALEVIVITGFADVDKAVKALRLGATDFLHKPLKLVDLQSSIIRTRKFVELSKEVNSANKTIDLFNNDLQNATQINFIGRSEATQKIIKNIMLVAQSSDTSVLITGESGTGKELVARSVHLLSDRAKQPFFAVNSSAIPESLFESELFGYKKGAFTGATESKPGWFEKANNGTLFLDEISEMNQLMQAKMLRVLEDKKVRRLGSGSEIDLDVRIISASNKNFDNIIKQDKFRADLYYRLAVFVINLPPLRERKEDIPLLIEFYTKHFSEKMRKNITSIDNKVFEQLSHYYFPGNIRELRNIIERGIILCSSNILDIDCFNFIKQDIEQTPEAGEFCNYDLEENEKKLIISALKKADNNKAQAAKLLNISWQSLDRRLTKFKLNN